MALLEVRDLQVQFGPTRVLRGISFDIDGGETLGVVGESGCGKSMTGFALMGMVPSPGVVTGSIKLDGLELLGRPERDWRDIRGQELALVMQDPFTSLNPMMRIGAQIAEALRLHQNVRAKTAWDRSVELLDQVGVPAPEASARKYPHQMSGGQRQRVVIAMAFAAQPKVLIADEPTTALDVTLQAQILRLLNDLQRNTGTAVMLISHDIGAIGSVAHRIAVFYAGRIVETGTAEAVLRDPRMPYTQALLGALPTVGRERLEAIPGSPPNLASLSPGCAFAPRCPHRFDRCTEDPELTEVAPN
ncbi:MAG TPA: ABC transporter ATP-binding protein, partial [Fimbriimonadaceae bacterium]|nr:ABC transporter ATP-binding protein [Fimbriimonadaceae bacterium]